MNNFNMLLRCLFFVAIVPLLAVSCSKDLQDDVNDLKDRVTSLEQTTAKLQQAIDAGKLITAVNPIAATPTTPAGWEIVFSDSSKVPVYNGEKGDPGIQGPKGDTPYIWVNSAGNWATNMGSKPSDSDDPKYELKVGDKSVKAYGSSTRTINQDGFVAFEEYDAVSGVVKNTVVTTIPYNHKNYITAIVETDESVTMIIDGKSFTMAKAAVYPESITVIRDKDWVIKGGTVEFNIAVNSSTNKSYTKEAFELDYEKSYAVTRGVSPDFIKIKDVQPVANIKGQYTMTLEWAESATSFAKNAAIFVILNFTDVKGNPAKVMSATPVIMNEKYVSIKDENVLSVNDIYMFTDETFTDSVRLSNYHEGYVNTVGFVITPLNLEPKAVNDPFTRYTSDGDKYKFTVVPIPGSNSTVWPAGVYTRVVDVKASVTDHGRAAVPVTPARPDLGIAEIPGIPAIDPVTINKDFTVTVYKVPADGVIYRHDFNEYWIPNKTVDYKPSVNLGAQFATNGYAISGWNFDIKSQTLKKDGTVVAMANNVAADESKFTAANNYAVSYKLLPTINAGTYDVELIVTATPKVQRPTGLSQSREFKVIMTFKVVPPSFTININNPLHSIIPALSDTYNTYKLSNVMVSYILDVESTKNISKPTDLTPNTTPLGYEFDLTDPRHGAQGVRFNPYPSVTAPVASDWGSLMFIKKPITIFVKLDTGQEIPVQVMCQASVPELHATGKIFVQYNRLNLHHVDALNVKFAGNYNAMLAMGIDISAANNFTPQSSAHITLDPTMIKTPGGIVYSEVGTVQCEGGTLPSGLSGKKILSINATTGMVKSIDGMTWENPEAVLYQTFRVTYTDIWGNSASKDVNVYVKSNGVPAI